MKRIGNLKKTDFNKVKSTSIKKRITNAIISIIIVLSIVLGGLAGYLSYSSRLALTDGITKNSGMNEVWITY